jgi:hypothetical protein
MALEHFQEKWNPAFRPKMRQRKNASGGRSDFDSDGMSRHG